MINVFCVILHWTECGLGYNHHTVCGHFICCFKVMLNCQALFRPRAIIIVGNIPIVLPNITHISMLNSSAQWNKNVVASTEQLKNLMFIYKTNDTVAERRVQQGDAVQFVMSFHYAYRYKRLKYIGTHLALTVTIKNVKLVNLNLLVKRFCSPLWYWCASIFFPWTDTAQSSL